MRYLLLLAVLWSPAWGSYVDIQWAANPETDIQGYRLFRSSAVSMLEMSTTTAMGDSRITKRTLGVVTAVRDRLAAGTSYYYRLTAFNAFGQSPFNVDEAGGQSEPIAYQKMGDVDRDGSVGVVDLSMLIAYWATGNHPGADFNNDGTVNIVDLSILIASWGQ